MTIRNIQSGFRSTGIFPFDPDVVPETAFAPSTLTHKDIPEVMDGEPESYNSSDDDLPLGYFLKNHNPSTRMKIEEKSGAGCSHWTDQQTSAITSDTNKKINILNTTIIKTKMQDSVNKGAKCSAPEKNLNFSDILKTPDMGTVKSRPKRKALNYKAQLLKREIFTEHSYQANSTKSSKSQSKPKGNWLCGLGGHSCGDDCVDLTPADLPVAGATAGAAPPAGAAENNETRVRDEVCDMLCLNGLGKPLCKCPGGNWRDDQHRPNFIQSAWSYVTC
ncbi:unnamed protein product [Acanthoscelides obtectus]|uniref:Uncharacterized protein n=1 Tax=Acanthoscelides obtectus TaxID=200917 RepID=A0A9P0LHS4_ACAOB|nr:unnamed protein product [Acanthoscelides obtectus]CAK1641850.1 hypothetical protein AOBTE_LOCUS12677 [Acanthoscelides obtectus]